MSGFSLKNRTVSWAASLPKTSPITSWSRNTIGRIASHALPAIARPLRHSGQRNPNAARGFTRRIASTPKIRKMIEKFCAIPIKSRSMVTFAVGCFWTM